MRFSETNNAGPNWISLLAAVAFALGHILPMFQHEGGSEIALFGLQLICFIVFGFIFLVQLLKTLNKETRTKKRLFSTIILGIGVIATLFLPEGIAYHLRKKEDPLLLAQIESTANCLTTFSLRKNNTFLEKTFCFGEDIVTGNYVIKNDTIFFENINLARSIEEYYKYAVIKPPDLRFNNRLILVRYKNEIDSIGHKLWIVKNNLPDF